jgi:DNA-binding NarL/FixJ family response regulator
VTVSAFTGATVGQRHAVRKTPVLIIEDNRVLREGLAALLNSQPDLETVAALGTTEGLIPTLRKSRPSVVLLDLGLSSHNSLRVVGLLKDESPDLKIVVMGFAPTQADIVEFVTAGVSGFLLKDATFDDFARTIRAVIQGESVLPPPLTTSLFSQIVHQAVKGQRIALAESVRLTNREREIVELIAEALSNKEIAQRLNLATHTVKSHVHNILAKLALHTRLQVAGYAYGQISLRRQRPPS